MKNIEELKAYIEKMRTNLQFLIANNDDLLDKEIITISQKLDKAINNYNALTRCLTGSYQHNRINRLQAKDRRIGNI